MFYGFGKPLCGKPFFGKSSFGKPFGKFGKGFPATKSSGFNKFIPSTTVATTPFPGWI